MFLEVKHVQRRTRDSPQIVSYSCRYAQGSEVEKRGNTDGKLGSTRVSAPSGAWVRLVLVAAGGRLLCRS